MTVETTTQFEQDKDNYVALRDSLADGSLSQEERDDLHERYDADCEEVHDQTMELCAELQREVNQYTEMTQMSKGEFIKLQILTGIPKAQIDGLRGPTSFAQYQSFMDSYPDLVGTGPQTLSEKYDEIFESAETYFNSLSLEERKEIQRVAGTPDDGKFGPNTFQKICESVSQNDSLRVFLNGQILVDKVSDTSQYQVVEPVLTVAEDEVVVETGQQGDELEPVGEIQEPVNSGIQEENEEIELTDQEKIDGLKQQAGLYNRSLIRQLQAALENIGVDGLFGNESANRILEKYPELTNLEDVFAREGINTDVDGVLSSDGSPEVFRNLYGDYIDVLGSDLGLPSGFIEAIIRKETTYGAALNSPTGSKGLMQLTKWPFKDMRGDHRDNIGLDSAKVLRYQDIFQRIDLDALLAVEIGEEGQTEQRIPEEVISHLRTIQDSENITEIQTSITQLYNHIKGNRHEYDHETNMIIGSVYLAYQYDRANGDIWQTARNYNGDRKIASNGNQIRTNYANTVQSYFNALQ